MNANELIALIAALLSAAPTLTADAAALLRSLTSLFNGNSGVTAADIKTAIANSAAATLATDAKLEAK